MWQGDKFSIFSFFDNFGWIIDVSHDFWLFLFRNWAWRCARFDLTGRDRHVEIKELCRGLILILEFVDIVITGVCVIRFYSLIWLRRPGTIVAVLTISIINRLLLDYNRFKPVLISIELIPISISWYCLFNELYHNIPSRCSVFF